MGQHDYRSDGSAWRPAMKEYDVDQFDWYWVIHYNKYKDDEIFGPFDSWLNTFDAMRKHGWIKESRPKVIESLAKNDEFFWLDGSGYIIVPVLKPEFDKPLDVENLVGMVRYALTVWKDHDRNDDLWWHDMKRRMRRLETIVNQ